MGFGDGGIDIGAIETHHCPSSSLGVTSQNNNDSNDNDNNSNNTDNDSNNENNHHQLLAIFLTDRWKELMDSAWRKSSSAWRPEMPGARGP